MQYIDEGGRGWGELTSNEWFLINPRRNALLELLRTSHNVGRMAISDAGNVYIWDAYDGPLHDNVKSRLELQDEAFTTRLGGSLYAFSDGMAARLYEIGDEEVLPDLTEMARQLPNVTRIWGRRVECIDIHWEP